MNASVIVGYVQLHRLIWCAATSVASARRGTRSAPPHVRSTLARSQARPALCARVSPHRRTAGRGGAARSARVPVRRRHRADAAATAFAFAFSLSQSIRFGCRGALAAIAQATLRAAAVRGDAALAARLRRERGAGKDVAGTYSPRAINAVRHRPATNRWPRRAVPFADRRALPSALCPVAPAVPGPPPPLRMPCLP